MMPSQPGPPRSFGLFLHLKSGAFGFRFDNRSSHIAPPQIGHAGIPSPGATIVSAAWFAEVTARVASRGGQMTPSHSRSLHLKSGALGFFLPTRLSHMSPEHFGHDGDGGGASPTADCSSLMV